MEQKPSTALLYFDALSMQVKSIPSCIRFLVLLTGSYYQYRCQIRVGRDNKDKAASLGVCDGVAGVLDAPPLVSTALKALQLTGLHVAGHGGEGTGL